MAKLRTVGLLLLLVLLTGGVVLLPPYVSGQRKAARLAETVYRDHSAASRTQIASDQVAWLYYNREIGIGPYNSMFLYEEGNDSIRQTVAEMLDRLFAGNPSVGEPMKEMAMSGDLYYSPSSVLTNLNEQPLALTFVEVGVEKGGEKMGLLYEEKTKTLIRFSYSTAALLCDSEEEGAQTLKKLRAHVKAYYEQLGLRDGEYYFSGEVLGSSENHTLFGSEYFSFGIAQYEDTIAEEEIYNSDTK